MNEAIKKQLEQLTLFVLETDCRILAMEKSITDVLTLDKVQREKFRRELKENFDLFLQLRQEQAEDVDPSLAARLFHDQNPYVNDQSSEEGK